MYDGVARVDLHAPLSRHHPHLPAVGQGLRSHDALHVRAVTDDQIYAAGGSGHGSRACVRGLYYKVKCLLLY